ncbi:MAG: hypothetical protein EHM45_15630 [Desulfobacteraceae bacterium]|nr:MAG: hypothetical protein EHM45_15630 [Desulfobacteraceae bacterium]
MRVAKFLVIGIGVCFFLTSAFVIIGSGMFSKAQAQTKPVSLDCAWKCDEKMKECVCTGKDCQKCTGKKAMGGKPPIFAIRTCRTTCTAVCTASIGDQCVEMSRTCVDVCSGQ